MSIIFKYASQPKAAIQSKKLARFGGVFSHPIKFLRWTGCFKCRPVSYKDFNPITYAEQRLFTAPKPNCAVDPGPWTASQAIDTVMSHTLVLEDAIVTCYGYVFDRKGRLIVGATHKLREPRKYPRWITRGPFIHPHPLFPTIHYYRENVIVLTASTQNFYFHWLIDILPRLGMIEKIQEKADLIFIQRKHRFQKESLETLGINEHQIINASDVAVLTAKKVIVPCHQIMKGREIPSWVIQYLRDRLLPASSETAFNGPRRIYISRRSTHRRIENEKDIIWRLKSYGFTSVELEKFSFREQIKLFQGLQVVVSPHGSGLANLVFSSPGTIVIELFPAANNDLYYRLSTALKLRYYYVKARDGNPTRWTLEDYAIDWQDLKETLDESGISLCSSN